MRPVPGLSHERLERLARADTGGRMHGSSIGCRLLGGVLRRLYCRFQGTARMDHERPYRMTNTSKPWFRCCGSPCCRCGWQSSARRRRLLPASSTIVSTGRWWKTPTGDTRSWSRRIRCIPQLLKRNRRQPSLRCIATRTTTGTVGTTSGFGPPATKLMQVTETQRLSRPTTNPLGPLPLAHTARARGFMVARTTTVARKPLHPPRLTT